MPAVEVIDLHDWAVLWVRVGVNRHSEPTVASAVEIAVRWNDVNTEMLTPEGTTFVTDAVVICKRDIPLGSLLWHGRLIDLPGTGVVPESDVMEVKSFNATRDLKGRATRRQAGLMRYRDSLPAIVA